MMTATFKLYLASGDSVPEAGIPEDAAVARTMIDRFDDVEGGLVITEPAAGDTPLGDTLGVLMMAFCLRGLATLRTQGHIQVDFFEHEQIVDVRNDGERVTLSGDDIETRSYPADDYFAVLAACGARYVALAHRLWDGMPERTSQLAVLDQALAETRQPL